MTNLPPLAAFVTMSSDGEAKNIFTLVNVDFKALSTTARVLVDRVSEAIGGGLKPWQIRRVAEAEADARVTAAMTDVRIESMRRRAVQRWVDEETQNQANMEAITAAALPQVNEDAKPEKIERDWLVNFFDKSRLTSDEDMQKLWASILAGEANAPGKFSKRTINFLASMDKDDAEKFRALCRFNWTGFAQQPMPVIFNHNDPIYTTNGITWANLVHLEEIGLLTFESFSGVGINRMPQLEKNDPVAWFAELLIGAYGGKSFAVYPGPRPATLSVGRVKLSRVGSDIAKICDAVPVPGFVEYAISHWQAAGAKVRELMPDEVLTPEMMGLRRS